MMLLKKTITTLLLLNLGLFSSASWAISQQQVELQRLMTKAKKLPLHPNQFANSLTLLPPPPKEKSAAFEADKEAYLQTRSLINTPRWQQATQEAAFLNGTIGNHFSNALGIKISKTNTPITHDFMEDLMIISGYFATETAKTHYQRIRPFMYFHAHSCTPQDENMLRKDGSYPSGHSAFGWSAALILSQIVPERQNEILKEGYEFGESRVICGAHWQSDVDAGRIIGAEVVARLQADKDFQEKIQQVKQEILNKLREKHLATIKK